MFKSLPLSPSPANIPQRPHQRRGHVNDTAQTAVVTARSPHVQDGSRKTSTLGNDSRKPVRQNQHHYPQPRQYSANPTGNHSSHPANPLRHHLPRSIRPSTSTTPTRDSYMTTLSHFTAPISPSSNPLFFIPDLIMGWTMSYANRISRQQLAEFLQGVADQEASINSEPDEFMRMLVSEDDDDDDEGEEPEFEVDDFKQAEAAHEERVRRRESSGLPGNEDWEVLRQRPRRRRLTASRASSPHSHPPTYTSGLTASPQIEGSGLPFPPQPVCPLPTDALFPKEYEGTKLPPTPTEMAAFEAGIPISPSTDSWTKVSLYGSKPGPPHEGWTRPASLTSPKQQWRTKDALVRSQGDAENTSAACSRASTPPRFIVSDISESVEPVFRKDDFNDPEQTLYDRHSKHPWSEILSDTTLKGAFVDARQGQSMAIKRAANLQNQATGTTAPPPSLNSSNVQSVHSSVNDEPPADLLVDSDTARHVNEDPVVFILESFSPILKYVRMESKRMEKQYRGMRASWKSGLVFANTSASRFSNTEQEQRSEDSPGNFPLAAQHLAIRREQVVESKAHTLQLRKIYRGLKSAMVKTANAVQMADGFRKGYETGQTSKSWTKPSTLATFPISEVETNFRANEQAEGAHPVARKADVSQEHKIESSKSELESRPEETKRALESESTSNVGVSELRAEKIESGEDTKEETACVV